MKYNILIVDDEELAIRGIERGVDWDRLQINKVFKTHTMETAKRILTDYHIQILLSDIELAGDSGIDLLRWARTKQKDLICIFFTCHAEFKYAQEAIKLGAVDYLLKPVPYKQLEELLSNSIKQLENAEKEKEKYQLVDQLFGQKSENPQQEDSHARINQVKKYIAENIAKDLQREELAAIAHFSPSHFARIFKQQEGISLMDYITEQRIELAKNMLRVTNFSVSEIGTRVGFDYPSYFSACFKKKTGITPQQYRENISKKMTEIGNLNDYFD